MKHPLTPNQVISASTISTTGGLKIVIMLGMLVIILCGIRFAAEIIVPFILALFIAVILNPLVQHMVRWRVPRVLAVSILMTIIVMAMVLLMGRPPSGCTGNL